MTTIFTTFRASLLACTIAAAPAFARDYVAVVPQATSDDRFVHELVLDLVLEQLGQGDTLRLVDGTSLATVATFQIPDDRRAEVPNLRRRALTGPMNDWAAFVARHYIDATPAAGEDGRLFIPQALDLVAQAHADRPVEDREVCVLIVGSARYEDPREDVFDMTGARVPSDGLIVAPRARSPFGTGDRQGDLAGVSVSILSRGDSWPSDLAEMRVGRVWGLHLQGRGGVMATFGSDPRTAIDSFLDCRSKPARRIPLDSTRSVEAMLNVSRIAEMEIEVVEAIDVVPGTIDRTPDAVGAFGEVVRLDQAAFGPQAGLITFDEIRIGSENPIYSHTTSPRVPPGMTVMFGGYFRGQRLGRGNECAAGANPLGCVAGAPSNPLELDPTAPAAVTLNDRSNPDSPSLSGTPDFSGPVSILFDREVAAVGLTGGYFNLQGSTAIQAFAADGSLIGGVVNLEEGMEFLALGTTDGSARISGIQFSLVGAEPAGYGVDSIRFALPGQYEASVSPIR